MDAHEKVCVHRPLKCRHSSCSFVSHRSEMSEHEKTCMHRPLQCPFGGCDFRGSKDELIEHIKRGTGGTTSSGHCRGTWVEESFPDYHCCGITNTGGIEHSRPRLTILPDGRHVVSCIKVDKQGMFHVSSITISVNPQPGVRSERPRVKFTLRPSNIHMRDSDYTSVRWACTRFVTS